ncbi:MAG: superoxide dismutase family protein [Actinomycetota bacterium]|nr:superoxide dismutase family protein [Actinomycetota bacterium]
MPTQPVERENPEPGGVLFGSATLTRPNSDAEAVTYNPELAPVGAAMTGFVVPSRDGTTQAYLTVSGLLPNRGYAVHAHTDACGATGDAAGPHFQNRVDPAATPQAESTNPEYANPDNEFWLDLRTDANGAGMSRVTVPFTVTDDRGPRSFVIHEAEQTSTGPGQAGQAGGRVACLTLSEQ